MIKSVISFLLFSIYMQTFAVFCTVQGQTIIECGTINNLITFGETGITRTRPQLNGEQIKLTDHFKLHYTFLPPDSTFQDWVDSLGVYAESCWVRTERIGWALPPPDNSNGGDAKYDIYIWGLEYKGVTCRETLYNNPYSNGYTSWIEILKCPFSDDFQHSMTPYQRLRSLIAHEFNHACQMRYRSQEDDTWFTENTSVYMERTIFPEANTLPYRLVYADDPLDSPFLQVNSAKTQDAVRYTGGLWPTFLHEKYGYSIVHLCWESMGTKPDSSPLACINSTLLATSSNQINLDTALRTYAIWRYFTGSRADTINFFKDSKRYPTSSVDSSHYFFPLNVILGKNQLHEFNN